MRGAFEGFDGAKAKEWFYKVDEFVEQSRRLCKFV
jgi:hypothetical protein